MEDDENSPVDARAIFHTILERWWVILLCLLFTLGIGFLYILITPKTYKSTTVIQVEQAPTQLMTNIQDVTTEDLKEQEVLKTVENNLVAGELLINVIDRLNLKPENLKLKPRDPPYTKEEMADALAEEVTAKLTRGTRVIEVSALNTDPKLAQKISTAVVAEYVRQDMAQRIGVSGEANKFLLEQADTLKKRVSIAEDAAQSF
jgi:succinoglycan biosynthesis transport protein ExoP